MLGGLSLNAIHIDIELTSLVTGRVFVKNKLLKGTWIKMSPRYARPKEDKAKLSLLREKSRNSKGGEARQN